MTKPSPSRRQTIPGLLDELASAPCPESWPVDYRDALAALQRQAATLRNEVVRDSVQCTGTIVQAAADLGVSVRTMHRLLAGIKDRASKAACHG